MPGLSQASHYIQGMLRTVMHVTEVVLVDSITSWGYNLVTQLCFKCNVQALHYFAVINVLLYKKIVSFSSELTSILCKRQYCDELIVWI